jgi:hypothetical protein
MKVGDPVTVLAPAVRKWQGRWVVRRTRVLELEPPAAAAGYFIADSVYDPDFVAEGVHLIFTARAEGIRWIRGHHTRRSREGQAVLAAGMLVG